MAHARVTRALSLARLISTCLAATSKYRATLVKRARHALAALHSALAEVCFDYILKSLEGATYAKSPPSVALNPIIKFTTMFGMLAVELAVSLTKDQGPAFTTVFAALFMLVSVFFVWRSFYGMRIEKEKV
jgi:hypothetical protein